MNKKVNTVLFVIGGTLFNIILAVSCILVLFILLNFVVSRLLPGVGQDWVFPLSFLAGIVGSFFIYRAVIKAVSKKIDLEKYLDPIFVKTNIKKTQN